MSTPDASATTRTAGTRIPEKPSLDGIEARWSARWDADGTYRFDRTATRDQVFSIDTPPPTVSGSLHVGHVFSYTHTDTVARFWRMRGKAVFYPMGWDDNGLATERRVQNFFGVRCDPSLPYDPGFAATFEPPAKPDVKNQLPVSRPNFVELCKRLVVTDEAAFESLFRTLGLSVDWTYLYTTIDDHCVRTSQAAFLRNVERGEAYAAEAPTLWDVDYRTAVAQAELVDKDVAGAYHRLPFRPVSERAGVGGEADVPIDTTRPELLASCVALVAHPDDERYRPLFGSTVTTPLFGVEVPVLAHRLADPEKGTGIAMICTFGDTTDVTWWRELQLPTRTLIQRDGRLQTEVPAWITTPQGRAAYGELAGSTAKQAQRRIVELLRDRGELIGEPEPITHPVKFYERGDRPLEIVASRQWYIRNGGRDDDLRAALLARGDELRWHPDYMRHRYGNWVEGLNGDWLVSRQRFFGVPFPVWYPVLAGGELDRDHPIYASPESLPIDPSTEVPPGFTSDRRDEPGGFSADPDVMDTWATSSLTPQIAGHWVDDADLFSRVFPMSVRPQSHEIIRTWLFATVVRAHAEHGSLPFTDAAISGWILDPDRKKMSKSVGNVVTPTEYFDRYGADAVRYWASNARPGMDTAFDEGQMKIGRKVATKLLNASRFVLTFGEPPADARVTAPLDVAMLRRLGQLIVDATDAFESFDYARALERTEAFFWWFCDDYVELVKGRAYGTRGEAGAGSALVALRIALSVLQRSFAPFLPFATEEVWSWWHDDPDSVHRASWPVIGEAAVDEPETEGDLDALLDVVGEVLAHVRRAKTEAKVSQRARVAELRIDAPTRFLQTLHDGMGDLIEACGIDAGSNRSTAGTDGSVTFDVILAPADAASPGRPPALRQERR